MTRALYSLLMWLLQPLLRLKLRRRARAESGYAMAVQERFGYYTAMPGAPRAGSATIRVWVHAVSLGETRAAATLLARLRVELPGMQLLLTHSTATGRAQGQALLQEGDLQVWQPWDTPWAVRRFLGHFQPSVGLLMETEIWPNLVAQCVRAGVPLCLVNARLSQKSLRQAQRLAWLARPAYGALTAVWAQSAADAQRLEQIGAPVRGVMGNFKFDAAPDPAQLAQGLEIRARLDRPVVIFASSREGEERLFLLRLQEMRALPRTQTGIDATKTRAIDVQWLIVPRHPQRFDEVERLCLKLGFSVARRSVWGVQPVGATILLGDSLGEMAMYFAMSDVGLLGGSFEPLGGQNLIEAAACGCPVIMGPHTFNFSQAAEISLEAGAALREPDMAHAVDRAIALLGDAASLQTARDAAISLSRSHRGAARRTAAAVRDLLFH